MNKELTQKIIEAGIVPAQALKQLKAWKQLPDDAPEEEQQQVTQRQLMGFVEDIGELLEKGNELPELKETIPGIYTRFENKSRPCLLDVNSGFVDVLEDAPDCLIFKSGSNSEVGNQVLMDNGNVYEIVEASPIYIGDVVTFYRCGVQEVPKHAQALRFRAVEDKNGRKQKTVGVVHSE